jgi:hypothetical protein
MCCIYLHRFLNAKPTLEASREQAVRTHRWRQRCNVDSVLTRPCDGFEKISATFPTYTLLDNSPDGHAVVMMKVRAVSSQHVCCEVTGDDVQLIDKYGCALL